MVLILPCATLADDAVPDDMVDTVSEKVPVRLPSKIVYGTDGINGATVGSGCS
jgi:hypothetical protein